MREGGLMSTWSVGTVGVTDLVLETVKGPVA